MVQLKEINHNTKLLPELVADQIVERIATHKIEVGSKLPNEFEMAEQLKVGRGTIREAIKILVSRNVVEIKRGCGTFVCEKPGLSEDPLGLVFVEDKKKLALDLCEIRLMIEPQIAAFAAERATDEEAAEIMEACREVEKLIRLGQPHEEKDIYFHGLIAKYSKNQVVPNLIPVVQSAISLFINVTDAKLLEETIVTHRMAAEGIQEHNPEKARQAMTEHMELNRNKIMEMIR